MARVRIYHNETRLSDDAAQGSGDCRYRATSGDGLKSSRQRVAGKV